MDDYIAIAQHLRPGTPIYYDRGEKEFDSRIQGFPFDLGYALKNYPIALDMDNAQYIISTKENYFWHRLTPNNDRIFLFLNQQN